LIRGFDMKWDGTNKMIRIASERAAQLHSTLQAEKGLWIAELDGRKVDTWLDYISEVEVLFRFPPPAVEEHETPDGYLDWMTDLSWLGTDGYIMIIDHFRSFMKGDVRMREVILSTLQEVVLPFWQEEVVRIVIGGTPKPFMVYLIDDD